MAHNIHLCFSLAMSFSVNQIISGRNQEPPENQMQSPVDEVTGKNVMSLFDKILLEKGRGRKKKRIETIYEPYWFGGEWIYYRTTGLLRKKKTKPTTTTTPWSSTTTRAPRWGETTSTPTTAFVNYMCQHPCLGIYEDYGLVCAKRFNGWEYEMRQFDDACDVINENCINPVLKTRRRDRWFYYRGPWYVVYRGPCWELTTRWVYPPTNITALLIRNLNYISQVDYNILNSVYAHMK